jgi:predicted DNA-binding transcriptional regulator YafY
VAEKRVDRVERLTNLLALLLEATSPLTMIEIVGELVGQYPEGERARRAAFERDKAALRDLGVPIETDNTLGGSGSPARYRIDRRSYELADLDLDADERRALQIAVAAVRTDTSAGRDAIWKLGGSASGETADVTAVVPDRPELPVLRTAIARRAPISFDYRGASRTVEPWGLLLRGGFWYVVGHDHLRDDKRTFRVDRFDGGADGIEVGAPGSFERPAAFDPRDAFPVDPKQIGHAPSDGIVALVRVDRTRADAIARELGPDRVVARHADGGLDVEVPASNLDAFRSWVLGLLDHAVVLGPPDVRESIVAWLRQFAVPDGVERPGATS